MDIKHSWHLNVNKPALEICSYDQELIFTEETGEQVRIDGLERKVLLHAISNYFDRLKTTFNSKEDIDASYLLLIKSKVEEVLITLEEEERNGIW